MNNFFVPEPHQKTVRVQERPNSKTYTMKMLRQCAGSELPLHLDVSATKKDEGYAVYNITTSSVSTQNRWHASYRYSEFLAFRNQVEEVWTCHDEKCSGSCQSLRDLIEASFPKKTLNLVSTWSITVEDRKLKFKNVLIHLLRSVLLPGSTMKCFHARQQLPPALFEFLGIEDVADQRTLLQVYVDNHQGGMKKSASHTGLSSLEHRSLGMKKMSSMKKSATTPNLAQMELEAEEKAAVPTVEAQQCMVCLDDIEAGITEGPHGLVNLPCKHAFHRECIFEWLMFQYHCPMCRAQVGPAAMTNYCCPKKQEQWWLGNFKENPLEREQE